MTKEHKAHKAAHWFADRCKEISDILDTDDTADRKVERIREALDHD